MDIRLQEKQENQSCFNDGDYVKHQILEQSTSMYRDDVIKETYLTTKYEQIQEGKQIQKEIQDNYLIY